MRGAGFGNHACLTSRVLQLATYLSLELVLEFELDRTVGQGSITNPCPLYPQS